MKKYIALIALLQLGIIAGANEKSSNEGVDVIATKENIVSGTSFRHESISADITGHTLTITFNDNVGIAKRYLRAHYADVIYANIINIVPEN